MATKVSYKPLLTICVLSTLFLSSAMARQGASPAPSRRELLMELKKCEHLGPQCNEDSVDKVFQLYQRGDKSVLKNLMDVAPGSDGALSEALGMAFGEILCTKPRTYLSAVAMRPRKEHETLLFLATAGDGSGMGCRQIVALRRRLKRISVSRGDRLAGLASECLVQLNENNRDN
ncbi:MAG: hypothetical protein LC746_04990 [Acidobacteria bacterium]|nr:hypothetical protein [Acidobacteriota bacterium]